MGALMPRERAAMHLDTVFTFCDRAIATAYSPVVSQIIPVMYRPDGDGGVTAELSDRPFIDEVQDAMGLEKLTVVTTGGDEFEAERNQWDDGNNVVALAPGVIVAYERNEAPTRSSPAPASRCTRSRARSWAADAAAGTA
jgi:Arginine deiminase